MSDVLVVSYDFDEEKNEKALCIVRHNYIANSDTVIKHFVGDKAESMYNVIVGKEADDA